MTQQVHLSEPLRDVVAARVAALQARYLARTSTAVAQLAALRSAVTGRAGDDPRTWELTVAGISPSARGDEPTAAEVAAHAAMTLYALHQQSKPTGMHVTGRPLGAAVARLGERSTKAAVRRRFEVLGTSATLEELLHHLRGMVRQLRSADVPLDYGALAHDLLRWQDPAGSAAVRLRWGRDYHRIRPDQIPTEPTSYPSSQPSSEQE